MKIHQVITRHLPSITLKSYGSNVDYCRCGKFTPKGDDDKSWKEWAKHVEEVYWKSILNTLKRQLTSSAIRPHSFYGTAPLASTGAIGSGPQRQRASKARKAASI